MAGLINLPGYAVPNALNFSGLNAGIDSIRDQKQQQVQNALMQDQMGMKREQLGMQRESHGVQMAQARTAQEMQEARMVAGRIQHIQGLPPEQQGMAWNEALKAPGFRDLPPDMRDFSRAAPMLLSKASEYMGPEEKAKLGLVQAQTAKALREASDAGGAYGKDIKIFQGQDGRMYGVQAGARGELKYHDLSAPGAQTQGGPPAMGQQPAMPQSGAPIATPGGQPQGQDRQPLTPFRGVKQVGNEIIDIATGRPVRNADDALRGAKFVEADAKASVDDIKGRMEGIQASRSKMPRLQIMADLIGRPDVYQGTGANAVLEFKKAAQSLGFEVEGVPAAEAIRAIGNQFALQLRNPAGGEGMPGALSDSDRNFLVQSTPGLTNTQQGNQIIVRTMIDLEQHKIRENTEAARYLREKRSSAGLSEHMQAWADKNPALSKATRDLITRTTGVQYGVRSGPAAGPRVDGKSQARITDQGPRNAGSFAAPGLDGGLPAIVSDDDYTALPSGAEFIAPDGSRRRKP